MKLIRLPEACPRIPGGYTFLYRLVLARGHPRLGCYVVLYRLLLARGYPRSPGGSTATLASKAYIHGLI